MSNMNMRLEYIKCGCGEHNISLKPTEMKMECGSCKRVWDIIEQVEDGKEKGKFWVDLKKIVEDIEF